MIVVEDFAEQLSGQNKGIDGSDRPLGRTNAKVLLILPEQAEMVLSARNVANLKLIPASQLNIMIC